MVNAPEGLSQVLLRKDNDDDDIFAHDDDIFAHDNDIFTHAVS